MDSAVPIEEVNKIWHEIDWERPNMYKDENIGSNNQFNIFFCLLGGLLESASRAKFPVAPEQTCWLYA